MEEQLISFDTAKLAKEKGFKEPTKKAWVEITNKESNFFGSNKCRDVNASKLFDYEYYAPTQSLLQKWLRDKFNIILIIDYLASIDEFTFDIIRKDYDREYFDTYEQALEIGLQEALKLI